MTSLIIPFLILPCLCQNSQSWLSQQCKQCQNWQKKMKSGWSTGWRISVADPGGGSGGSGPPLSDLTTLKLKFLHQQNRISLFNWLIFLMKRAWHLPTKLNSRDIKKCNCFWVPSYDLFVPARKAVFTSRIQVNGKRPKIYNVQPRLVGGGVGEK